MDLPSKLDCDSHRRNVQLRDSWKFVLQIWSVSHLTLINAISESETFLNQQNGLSHCLY